MSGYFDNKVSVVTGGAAGLGLGLTEQLLARGAAGVFMADVNQEHLDRESARLSEQYPGKVFPMLTDVTKLAEVATVLEKAKAFCGHLDFVFNNAGVGMTLPTEQITFDIWKSVVDLNLMGVVHGTYSAIPLMREQGFGHIVNTGSITGLIPVPYQAVYAATKAAVLSMTESLQYELEHEGLSFSVICPGNVITSIFGDMTPPPDAVGVDEAVDFILQQMETKALLIVLPEKTREVARLYRENRQEFDTLMRHLAAERRENYRTKGTYY